jgi:hypothetical protein
MVADYEVMPWPERIYTSPYQLANSTEKVLIPRYYSTQMQVMVNALNDMPLSDNRVNGSHGIGVAMSNSLMFQRYPTHNGFEDPQFSHFYGQTLPLLKRGVPVETVHLENLTYAASLKNIKVLILSYSNMKPASAEIHQQLADWINKGGVLIYCGKDEDPYQTVMEWWNTGSNQYQSPSQHLFELMKINPAQASKGAKYGKGTVYVIRYEPKEFVMKAKGDDVFISTLKQAYEKDAKAGSLTFKNHLALQRGPYEIVSVMDENQQTNPYVLKGLFIDLFNPELPILTTKTVQAGEQGFLYNLGKVKDKSKAQVLASASRIYDETVKAKAYNFTAKSPAKTTNSMRVLLPAKPKQIKVQNHQGENIGDFKQSWDAASKTVYLSFENSPDGVKVGLEW